MRIPDVNRSFFVGVVLTAIGMSTLARSPAAAQGLLERLGDRLRTQAAQPNSAAPAPASAYIGLVGDDRGEAGRGVRVVMVRPDSPAEQAGIRPRDLITGIGSRTVRSIDDVVAIVSTSRPGEPLKFSIERTGRRMLINVVPTLRPPPDGDSPAAPPSESLPLPRPDPAPPAAAGPVSSSPPTLGVRVVPLDARTRSALGLTVRSGLVIQSVDFASPAEAAGLPVGGVIVAVDARPVESPEDLVATIRAARPGQKIEITYYHDRIAHRKSVTLAGAASPPVERDSELPPLVTPGSDSEPRDGDPGPDRPRGGLRILPDGDVPPAVREVERLLDRVLTPPAPAPAGGADASALQAEIERLRERVRQLETRMAELESRLSAPRE
jgi:membrane-associated protease RseP (regulator of RpoE activity)